MAQVSDTSKGVQYLYKHNQHNLIVSATQVFLEYQPMLQRIAFGMVGCVRDAEDLVQDTFEKWLKVDHQKVKNVKAYLIKMLQNACTNFLNSFRKTRELAFSSPLEVLRTKYEEADFRIFDFESDLATGIQEMLQRLTLPEFSILLLKEGFGFDYQELTVIFGRKLENCRQLLSRAKKKKEKPQLTNSLYSEKSEQLTVEILKIYQQQGNIQSLIAYLQKELAN